jgi:hypothetical protein
MNKRLAKKIAQDVSTTEMEYMFIKSRAVIRDWTQVSSVNKNMSKGASYNILYRVFLDLKDKSTFSNLIKTNIIWEFGDNLPITTILRHQELTKPKHDATVYHEEPNFDLGTDYE